jgi:DNA-binding PadR family transcriptional regulator
MRYDDDTLGWGFRGQRDRQYSKVPFRGFGLRYWILSLAYETGLTGAMISERVENMSMGHWRPSPGQVYPLLEQLVEDGLLRMELKDGKKYYFTTEKGKDLLKGSWFPWRTAGGLTGVTGIEDAVRNIENLVEYLLDNKEKVAEDKDLKSKVDQIVSRLKEL